jgi:hypothetical protein
VTLFTFILDHAGGTYVSQLIAPDQDKALQSWIERLDNDEIEGISKSVRPAFRETGANLVEVDGLTGVWCGTAIADEVLALLNVIRTESV